LNGVDISLSNISKYLKIYSDKKNISILPLLQISNNKIENNINLIKQKLKIHLEQETSQIAVSKEKNPFGEPLL